jgi:hypothetical protein
MKALGYLTGIITVSIGFFILLPAICWVLYIYSLFLSILTIDLLGLESLAYKTHYSPSGTIEYEHTLLLWFLAFVYFIGTMLFFWKLGTKAKARDKGAIIVLSGIIWGGIISWISFLLLSYVYNPLAQNIIFFIGALPYVVSGHIGEYLPRQYISFNVTHHTLSLRESRGLLYIFFSPQIFGVLLTYSISKIYEKVRK